MWWLAWMATVACSSAKTEKTPTAEGKAMPDVDVPTSNEPPLAIDKRGPSEDILFHRGAAPVLTGWEDSPEKLSAAYCLECHRETHAEWEKGMHSKAWTSPIFQRAYEFESHNWCVNCHAPLSQNKQGAEPWSKEGINCATCHVRDGQILGVRGYAGEEGKSHDVVATPYLGTSAFCAECHEFNFPESFAHTVTYSDQPMQHTYSEWLASGRERCQECHYSGHQLLGPHNEAWMREQFTDFQAEALDDELLHMSFRVARRGHITPTGDLFRSLVFVLSADKARTKLLYEKRWGRFFGTGWTKPNQISTHAMKRNSGLGPEQDAVSLTLDTPPAGPLYGALIFYYHDPFFAGEGKGRDQGSSLTIWADKLR
tara:strand:- start:16343 stop:17452 length:1110 start_codon:yes stop_codon:yes gene_type:complete